MRKAFFLFLTTLLGFGSTLQAQLFTQSPYSRFGIGQPLFQGYADQQAMGQTGIAMRNPLNMYLVNPASYSALKKTNFRFGVSSYLGTINQGTQSLKTNGAGLNYLAVGFQVNKKKTLGVSLGAIPYSNIGYNISFQQDTSVGSYQDILSGSGGITRYYLGFGYAIKKHWSIGLQASYLHGQADFARAVQYPSTSAELSYRESSTDYVRGFLFEGGAQYYTSQRRIKTKTSFDSTLNKEVSQKDTSYIRHQFGATYSLGSKLNNDRTFFARTYVQNSGNEYVLDTILLDESQKGTTTLPSTFGVGYVMADDNGAWRLALDFKMEKWTSFKSPYETQNLQDAWKVGAGFAFRPSTDFFNTKVSFLKKTEYRVGARYGKSYLRFNNTDITELGISFGLGIPLRTRTVNEEFRYEYVFSSLDFSVEYLTKGTLTNNLIQENYWRFVMGVSLNDKWFNKRKIE